MHAKRKLKNTKQLICRLAEPNFQLVFNEAEKSMKSPSRPKGQNLRREDLSKFSLRFVGFFADFTDFLKKIKN